MRQELSTPWRRQFLKCHERNRRITPRALVKVVSWRRCGRQPGSRISEYVVVPAQAKLSRFAVARAAGLPGRARQAGFALRVAPAALHLPWHRVVGAGGRIVFPDRSREHREQARRLRAEGVTVRDGRVPRSAMTDLENM